MTANGDSPGRSAASPIDNRPCVERVQTSPWLVWQLVDSAFPSGGFAHSGGLEATWQHGELKTTGDLASFLEASLRQLCSSLMPLMSSAHSVPENAVELDHLCDAFTPNHVANRASRRQGKTLLASAVRIYQLPALNPPLPYWHLAPVFGVVTRVLQVSLAEARQLFLFQHLRGLTAAAVRLNIIGPLEAQSLQYRLGEKCGDILQQYEKRPLQEMAQTAPLLDLWQGTQDRLYSRLFQS